MSKKKFLFLTFLTLCLPVLAISHTGGGGDNTGGGSTGGGTGGGSTGGGNGGGSTGGGNGGGRR